MTSIIILYDYFHPAYKAGGPIQSLANLVNELEDQLDIRVICSNADHDTSLLPVPYDQWVQKNHARVYYNSNGFSAVKKQLSKGSVAFINGVYSPVYNLLPVLRFRGRKIVSARGMLHPEGLLQKAWKKKIYLAAWKLLGLHRRCEFHATTEQEKQFIHKVFGDRTKVWVVQNLPNTLGYAPCPAKQPGSLRMATIALVSPMKNHLQVLQALVGCDRNITYDIYGPVKDEAYWQQCKVVIQKMPANVHVVFHGVTPPGKIEEVLTAAHVYIQPSKSENFGHSLYEALSKGRPVITSNGTPWNKLEASKAGKNVSPADIDQITQAICFFADMDDAELAVWSEGAHAYATAAIDVSSIKQQYIEMFTADAVAPA